MTHLRKMMLEELERRNYAQTTINCYLNPVALAQDAQARSYLWEERRLSIHGILSFANSTLATANHLGRKGRI